MDVQEVAMTIIIDLQVDQEISMAAKRTRMVSWLRVGAWKLLNGGLK